jgi:hypothetical protein
MALLMKQLAWIGLQTRGVPTSVRKFMFFSCSACKHNVQCVYTPVCNGTLFR